MFYIFVLNVILISRRIAVDSCYYHSFCYLRELYQSITLEIDSLDFWRNKRKKCQNINIIWQNRLLRPKRFMNWRKDLKIAVALYCCVCPTLLCHNGRCWIIKPRSNHSHNCTNCTTYRFSRLKSHPNPTILVLIDILSCLWWLLRTRLESAHTKTIFRWKPSSCGDRK